MTTKPASAHMSLQEAALYWGAVRRGQRHHGACAWMAETYCKAVRPDGTDFHSGQVRWLPPEGESLPHDGLIVTHPSVRRKTVRGGAKGYLSVATVPTDCTGMGWPCRLARVERTRAAVWTPDADLPHKRASWKWRVVEELDPRLALGPQADQIVALFERASRLTHEEIMGLAHARGAAGDAAGDAAWAAAWDAAWDAAWVAARDAARVAAGALVVADLIKPEHYRALVGPWASVCGDPMQGVAP